MGHINTLLDLYVRTQYDGKDYISVLEIYFYDDEGNEFIHETATDFCFGLITCGDLSEKFEVLKYQVEIILRIKGIKYSTITMVDED